jgi:hypothetical protein
VALDRTQRQVPPRLDNPPFVALLMAELVGVLWFGLVLRRRFRMPD